MCVRIMVPCVLGFLTYEWVLVANLVLTFCAIAHPVVNCHTAHLYGRRKASTNDMLRHLT